MTCLDGTFVGLYANNCANAGLFSVVAGQAVTVAGSAKTFGGANEFSSCATLVSSLLPAPQHAFTAAGAPDTGAVGGWASSPAPAGGAFFVTPNATTRGGPVTVSVTFEYAGASSPGFYQLLNLGGLSLTLNPRPGAVAPGVVPSSLLLLSNNAPGSSSCARAVFFDAAPALNGAAYPAPAGRRLLAASPSFASFAPGAPATIVFSLDATGLPVSITDGAGLPYLAIPFPSGGGPNGCAPLVVPAGTNMSIGGSSSVAAAFPGTVSSVAFGMA